MTSTLRIEADLSNLAVIRRFVDETATALEASPEAIYGLTLAVDELVTNIIVHGYRGQGGSVEIEMAKEGDSLVVRLRDQAPPFDPTTVPPPDLSVALDERPLGGLGIYLARQFMDEVIHRVTPQGGNEMTLVTRSH
jgi:serine/threonine-protein kinase RsbW